MYPLTSDPELSIAVWFMFPWSLKWTSSASRINGGASVGFQNPFMAVRSGSSRLCYGEAEVEEDNAKVIR